MALVQEASGSTTGTSLTITLGAAATAYNGVIIAVCGYVGGAITGITIGGVASTFTKKAASGGYNAEIWANLNVQPAQASASIVITASTAGIIAWVYEVPGYAGTTGGAVAPDKSAGTYSGTGAGTWSSGATATTVPASEFVVGLGLVLPNNSTTIAGPAGGWANETAIENVLGASGFYLSAVSGYQFPAGAGTFAYSGTVSPNADWAAVTATFLLMPNQGGWGGYVASNPAGFTSVSAAFTVPSLTGQAGSLASVWVGLGNVKQTGIYLSYNTGYSGNAGANPWTFFLPVDELWSTTFYPVHAGDALTLTLSYDASWWYAEIANATAGWTYTEKKSIRAALIGSGAWPFPLTTAEVIIENENTNLPDFGTLTFTGVTSTPAFASPQPIAIANTSIDAVPGAFSGGSFTMTWTAYG